MNLPRLHSTDAARNPEAFGAPVSKPAREAGAQEPDRRTALQKHSHTRAFTLIEIAIAIGVIGFALVAIMGILPFGLEVQRDNRSETIINQDATFWLEAIRNGAQGLSELPDYVTKIDVIETNELAGTQTITSYTRGVGREKYNTGEDIIGLLTRQANYTNITVNAYVTALSGSAAEKEPDASKRDIAFSYILRVLIEPGKNAAVSFSELDLDPTKQPEPLNSLHELRLSFAYPYTRPGVNPPRVQRYRASVSRHVTGVTNTSGEELYFFTP